MPEDAGLATSPARALLGRGLVLGLVLVLAGGCQAVARVTVAVRPTGDGTVSVALALDRRAVAEFTDVRSQLRLDDLRRAGWLVDGPATAGDGSLTVSATRSFVGPPGLAAVLGQLSGPGGPFSGLRLERQESLLGTRTRLTGTVDLRRGLDAFADARLLQQLGVGSLSSALAARRSPPGEDVTVRFELAARLPGRPGRSPGAQVGPGTAVWSPAMGSVLSVDRTASERRLPNLVLAGICALSVIGLLIVGLRRVTVTPRS